MCINFSLILHKKINYFKSKLIRLNFFSRNLKKGLIWVILVNDTLLHHKTQYFVKLKKYEKAVNSH